MTTLTEVMTGIAALLDGTVYPFPPDSVVVPCTVVGYPDIEYDALAPGSHVLTMPLWRLVAGPDTSVRSYTSDAITESESVKVIDGLHAFGDVRLTDATIEPVLVGALTYPAIRFDCEVLA